MTSRVLFFLTAISFMHVATTVDACTTFFMSNNADIKIMGKSYDWDMEQGLLVINKRGMKKRALVSTQSATPVTWQSKFANLTFNQYGREFPNGGINEAGLAVEIMVLHSSQYPQNPGKPVISELQWIQYQLDRFASVNEMITHADDISVIPLAAKVHYMACDTTMACASFEFIGGRMVTHSGDNFPVKSLTNDSYEESISFIRQYQGFGGDHPVTLDHKDDSPARFLRASHLVRQFNPATTSPVSYAYDIIENVSQGEYTKWRIVYDLAAMRVYFRTHDITSIKYVDIKNINGSCDRPVMTLNLATDRTGDAWPLFKKYTFEENYQIVDQSLKNTPPLPIEDAATQIARFPESFTCVSDAL